MSIFKNSVSEVPFSFLLLFHNHWIFFIIVLSKAHILHTYPSLLHLMSVIARAHTSTCATSLMHVKYSTRHFCL